ncbi:MAG: MotA/TolQ/ExbB proton channel family protein [Chitinophagales bacterium]|nr:MotA/TolQ/ExbB proton channel family protein [Chitinophagales bacterium]
MNGQEQSLLDIFAKMGSMGQFVSGLIFLLGGLAIYIFVERLSALKARKEDNNLLDKVNESISLGNITGAKDICLRANSPLSRVIYKGISRIGLPLKDIELAMEKAIDLEVFQMEKGEETLSLVSKLAPMLGFIGTIAGVIQIFYTINATGDYNIESISGGLYVKMITSALGLTLGIIAYYFYFVISKKIKGNVYHLERGSAQLIETISTPVK